jgi:hypothetical protein
MLVHSLRRPIAVATCAVLVALVGLLEACGFDAGGLGPDAGLDGAPTADTTVPDTAFEVGGDGGGADGPGLDAPASEGSDGGPDGIADAPEDSPQMDTAEEADAQVPDGSCDSGTSENCTNGVDDNCDGLVDCADPQCQQGGFSCAPAAPPGWTVVAYDESARPPCPSGWGSSAPNVEGPDGGSACQCACGAAPANPCLPSDLTMSLGQTLCGCPMAQNIALVADGSCDPIGRVIGQGCGPWGDGIVTAAAPPMLSCSDSRTLPPVTYAAQGETCVPMVGSGGGCDGGGACLPGPSPATACLQHDGIQPCPAGFPNAHVVYRPADVVDQRHCNDCGCLTAATACTGGTLMLYADPACGQSVGSLPVTGTCGSLVGDPTDAGWFVYTGATPNVAGCTGPATSSLDGGVAANNPSTVCCP